MNANEIIWPKKIIYMKRKTILLQLKDNSEFILKVPLGIPSENIDVFVKAKQPWMKKILNQMACRDRLKDLIEQNQIQYMGEIIPICLNEKNDVYIGNNQIFCPNLPILERKKCLLIWLKAQAQDILQRRMTVCCDKMGISIPIWSISKAKSYWGFCNSKNQIRLSWRLIYCPISVIDYVVIHELCHIRYKNHSAKFWEFLQKYNADYQNSRQYLKKNGLIFMQDGLE